MYTKDDIVPANRLRVAYGDEVILTENGSDDGDVHKILLEFDLGDRSYVVLQPEESDSEDGDPAVYRVLPLPNGEFEIAVIEDDEEWENVSELVDELTVVFPEDGE